VELAKTAVNWGSVPDWIAGIGTAAATIILTVGFLLELKRRRIEDHQRRLLDEQIAEDRRDEKARQARRVSARLVDPYGESPKLEVRNDSDQPIYDVSTSLHLPPDNPDTYSFILGPSKLHYDFAAGEARTFDVNLPEYVGDLTAQNFAVEITFTDARGSRWRKIGKGQPIQADEQLRSPYSTNEG
jgi:hypothetical protein